MTSQQDLYPRIGYTHNILSAEQTLTQQATTIALRTHNIHLAYPEFCKVQINYGLRQKKPTIANAIVGCVTFEYLNLEPML